MKPSNTPSVAASAVAPAAPSAGAPASSGTPPSGTWDLRRDLQWNLVHREGVGAQRARLLARQLGLLPQCRPTEAVRRRVEALDLADRALQRSRRSALSLRSLDASGCTRAVRRRAGLPVRGQRTKTNAKTAGRRNRARLDRARRA